MKTLAIVVTFNRIELLKRCVASLKNQTAPLDGILVVNNGSTDGTGEWLRQQEGINVLEQENLGGAGGFHHGMKEGVSLGYDWLWCMDDDCVVEHGAYNALLPFLCDKESIFGSIAVSEKEPSQLAWYTDFKIGDSWVSSNKVETLQGHQKVETTSIPFLGYCISSEVVKRIGLPLKEIFIWGDDAELSFRARINHSLKLYYVPSSVIKHPETKYVNVNLFGRKLTLTTATPLKRLYEYRNNLYLQKKYNTRKQFYLNILPKRLIIFAVQTFIVDKTRDVKNLTKLIKAIGDGLRGKLGKL